MHDCADVRDVCAAGVAFEARREGIESGALFDLARRWPADC
jgi:hypothetical protein